MENIGVKKMKGIMRSEDKGITSLAQQFMTDNVKQEEVIKITIKAKHEEAEYETVIELERYMVIVEGFSFGYHGEGSRGLATFVEKCFGKNEERNQLIYNSKESELIFKRESKEKENSALYIIVLYDGHHGQAEVCSLGLAKNDKAAVQKAAQAYEKRHGKSFDETFKIYRITAAAIYEVFTYWEDGLHYKGTGGLIENGQFDAIWCE